MAEVKSGWRRLRFDEMVTSAGATRKARGWTTATAGVEHYVGLEHLDSNSPTIQRWGSPDDVGENSDLRPFEAGDAILARRGIEQRKVGFAAFDGVASGHALVFRARPGVVLPEFLPYFLLSDVFMGRVDQFSAGSLSKTVNLSTLLRLEFALPPLEEQRRVARACAATAAEYEALAAARVALRAVRIATRGEVFLREVTPRSEVSRAGRDLPPGWSVQPVARVFDILDNRRVPIKDSERSARPGPYPYYGASGPIDTIDGYIFDEPALLLAEDGMNLLSRASPVVCLATGKYWVNNHAHVLRPRAQIDIDYAREYLESISYAAYVTGTYQKKITRSDCERIPVVVPPLEEQRAIASAFSRISAAEQLLESRAAAVRELPNEFLRALER